MIGCNVYMCLTESCTHVTIEDLELPHPENWVLEEGGDSVSRLCFQGKIGEEEYRRYFRNYWELNEFIKEFQNILF